MSTPLQLAAVDLGSNSFRLEIGRVEDGQIYIPDSLRSNTLLGARAQLAPEQPRHLDRVLVAQLFHLQQLGEDALFGVGELCVHAVGEQVGCAVAISMP